MLEALLLGSDHQAERVLRRVLPDVGIDLRSAANAQEASNLLFRRKFDAFFVDCDLPDGAELVRSLRRGASNRCAMVFAVLRLGDARRAFELGANFVLEKPLSAERTLRSLRAAQGLMLRERQRYRRHRLELPVTLEFSTGQREHHFIISNLSETGVAVRGHEKLPVGSCVRVCFTLPGPLSLDGSGEITWSSDDGRAGIRLMLSERNRQQLCGFLATCGV